MRVTTNFDRTIINDLKPMCTHKGANKASDIICIHDVQKNSPMQENQLTMFTESYYEAIGGYIALMANENYPEYFNSIQR
jgi:hypothetical protein